MTIETNILRNFHRLGPSLMLPNILAVVIALNTSANARCDDIVSPAERQGCRIFL